MKHFKTKRLTITWSFRISNVFIKAIKKINYETRNYYIRTKKLLRIVGKILEGPIVFLGVVWLVLLVVELIWTINKTLEYVAIGIWILFIIDFTIKFVLASQKLQFLKKNWLTVISLLNSRIARVPDF